jgi:aminoglycoside phosphotransferase (APT) family kinase protein
VASAGTENVLIRLGEDLALRLPRTIGAAKGLRREAEWLPRLAGVPFLHLPLALGEPADAFPYPFAVVPWVDGQDAWAAPPSDEVALAWDLGEFVRALRALPLPGPGHGGEGGSNRGGSLRGDNPYVRRAVAESADELDVEACLAAWDACLNAPEHDGVPSWFHGDLQPFNLILRQGRLAGVIDWGAMGTGDPACDLAPAWQVFGDPAARTAFRDAAGAGDAEWRRGQGWALAKAVEAIPYYRNTNPAFADFARRTLGRVLADQLPSPV